MCSIQHHKTFPSCSLIYLFFLNVAAKLQKVIRKNLGETQNSFTEGAGHRSALVAFLRSVGAQALCGGLAKNLGKEFLVLKGSTSCYFMRII